MRDLPTPCQFNGRQWEAKTGRHPVNSSRDGIAGGTERRLRWQPGQGPGHPPQGRPHRRRVGRRARTRRTSSSAEARWPASPRGPSGPTGVVIECAEGRRSGVHRRPLPPRLARADQGTRRAEIPIPCAGHHHGRRRQCGLSAAGSARQAPGRTASRQSLGAAAAVRAVGHRGPSTLTAWRPRVPARMSRSSRATARRARPSGAATPLPFTRTRSRSSCGSWRRAMDQGARGVSQSGCSTSRAAHARPEELREMARLVKKKGKVLAVHPRALRAGKGIQPTDAVSEAIAIAQHHGGAAPDLPPLLPRLPRPPDAEAEPREDRCGRAGSGSMSGWIWLPTRARQS